MWCCSLAFQRHIIRVDGRHSCKTTTKNVQSVGFRMQHAINLGYHDALMYIPPDIQVLMVSISLLLNNESSHADRSYDAYYLI